MEQECGGGGGGSISSWPLPRNVQVQTRRGGTGPGRSTTENKITNKPQVVISSLGLNSFYTCFCCCFKSTDMSSGAASKQSIIVSERQCGVCVCVWRWGGEVLPLVWRFGKFPILISSPAPCNGRRHLLYQQRLMSV